MKKILSFIFLLCSIALIQGCQDFLEPEIKTDILLENFGYTPAEASFLLTQTYIDVRDQNVSGTGYYQVLTTDYAVPPSGTALSTNPAARLVHDATEANVLNAWTAQYRAVSRANLVLDRATTAISKPETSAADKVQWTRIDGEARFLRAFTYFNLVRLYRNIPIVEKFFTTFEDMYDISNAPPDKMREQEAKVYEFMIADLNKAIAQLGDVSERGRPNKFSSQALLAKIQLTRATIAKHRDKTDDGKAFYEAALTNLNSVINSKRYALKTYFPDNFIRDKQHTGNNEALFIIEFNEADGTGLSTRHGHKTSYTGPNEYGSNNAANNGLLAMDFGWSVFDLNSPGDIVRRFWTWENGDITSFEVNGIPGLQNTLTDCPDGANCEVFVRTNEPYQFTRPYWFELAPSGFRYNPGTIDIVTKPDGQTSFSIVWNAASLTAQPSLRLVKYRRNPVTQPAHTPAIWDGDLPVMRYSEVLLMYAEVVNELLGPATAPAGNSLTATAAVNLVRDRARNFVYYPNMTVDTRVMPTGSYKATYGDIFRRQARTGTALVNTANAADTLAKYYNEISAFRGMRETPGSADIRNFKNFPTTANYVPDWPDNWTKDKFREELLDERWRELAGEQNLRWNDLTRYGMLVSRIQEYKTKINPLTKRNLQLTPFGQQVLPRPEPKFEYYPIPLAELNRNPRLYQNAGY